MDNEFDDEQDVEVEGLCFEEEEPIQDRRNHHSIVNSVALSNLNKDIEDISYQG